MSFTFNQKVLDACAHLKYARKARTFKAKQLQLYAHLGHDIPLSPAQPPRAKCLDSQIR
jgi:hypothetical protein